jgi:hypothetical protein
MLDACPSCGGELSERFGDQWETCYCLECGKPFMVGPFKQAKDLTQEQLVNIVERLHHLLWFDQEEDGRWFADPDKDDALYRDQIQDSLIEAGMKPEWVDDPTAPADPIMKVEAFDTPDDLLKRMLEIDRQRRQPILDDYSDDVNHPDGYEDEQ